MIVIHCYPPEPCPDCQRVGIVDGWRCGDSPAEYVIEAPFVIWWLDMVGGTWLVDRSPCARGVTAATLV